jgi:hypothetical protein
MSSNHPLWPSLIVVAGYLVADFFLDGITAALFVGSLGILEFLIILTIAKRAMPSLLVEGLALGAIGYTGFLIAVPGAGITILELFAGVVFLVSCLLGKPFLGGQIRKITGSGIRFSMARDMTFVFGLVFLAHGILMLVMILTGGISTPLAVAVFGVLYIGSVIWFRKKGRRDEVRSLPVLTPSGSGESILLEGSTVLGTVEVKGDRIAEVVILSREDSIPIGKFISALESALSRVGCRTARFTSWEGDTSPLEMSGYRHMDTAWQKVLPRDIRR